MKIREGFVSNSSSSSFICGVCNRIAEGFDWNNSAGGVVTCERGHQFCYDHSLNKDDEFWGLLKNDEVFPEKYCPICNGWGNYNLRTIYQFFKDRLDMSESEFIKQFVAWERNQYNTDLPWENDHEN